MAERGMIFFEIVPGVTQSFGRERRHAD
jgi:hypothetical protein